MKKSKTIKGQSAERIEDIEKALINKGQLKKEDIEEARRQRKNKGVANGKEKSNN